MKAMALVVALMACLFSPTGSSHSETAAIEERVEALIRAGLIKDAQSILEKIEENEPEYGEARNLLGDLHFEGVFGIQSRGKAVGFYREALDAGHVDALYGMGRCYEEGVGVDPSAATAFRWYDMGAAESPRAAARYAEIAIANKDSGILRLKHDPVDRLKYAASAGVARAQWLLGRLALKGELPTEPREAPKRWLEAAAETIPEAKTSLGEIYFRNGRTEEAEALFEQAMEAGDQSAAAYLGHFAEFGITSPRDRRRALAMYRSSKNIPWAREGQRRLEERERSIRIFGLSMYGTTRGEIQEFFNSMSIRRIGGEEHFDAYDVARELGHDGAVMTIAYAPGREAFVAEIGYQIPVEERRAKRAVLDELTRSLVEQYGGEQSEERSKGDRIRRWKTGSVEIALRSMNKQDEITITYQLAPYAKRLKEYVEKREQRNSGEIDDAF